MGRPIKIRNLATGRDDEYVAEVIGRDASRTALEIATATEITAGADGNKLVTPGEMAGATVTNVPAASTSTAGKVELATGAETIAVTDQTRAVTPYGLGSAIAKLYAISFTGKNGAGSITVTGTAVSDVVLSVCGISTVGGADAAFEATISVVNQIQQVSGSDLSTITYTALIYRPA